MILWEASLQVVVGRKIISHNKMATLFFSRHFFAALVRVGDGDCVRFKIPFLDLYPSQWTGSCHKQKWTIVLELPWMP
jgi:hypothetical protein